MINRDVNNGGNPLFMSEGLFGSFANDKNQAIHVQEEKKSAFIDQQIEKIRINVKINELKKVCVDCSNELEQLDREIDWISSNLSGDDLEDRLRYYQQKKDEVISTFSNAQKTIEEIPETQQKMRNLNGKCQNFSKMMLKIEQRINQVLLNEFEDEIRSSRNQDIYYRWIALKGTIQKVFANAQKELSEADSLWKSYFANAKKEMGKADLLRESYYV